MPRFVLLSQFPSRANLLDAVVASSFVPGVTGTLAAGAPTVWVPGRGDVACVDGGLLRNWPRLPLAAAARTVTVSAFPGCRKRVLFSIRPSKSQTIAKIML